MTPEGADKIIAARVNGLRPADAVIVSMVGAVKTDNPVVHAKPGIVYDWRWVRGLEVLLYFRDEDDWPNTAKDIALGRPAYLDLWNQAGQWGAHVYLIPGAAEVHKPIRQWRYELDFLPWMDFQNNDYITGRTYGRTESGFPYAINP